MGFAAIFYCRFPSIFLFKGRISEFRKCHSYTELGCYYSLLQHFLIIPFLIFMNIICFPIYTAFEIRLDFIQACMKPVYYIINLSKVIFSVEYYMSYAYEWKTFICNWMKQGNKFGWAIGKSIVIKLSFVSDCSKFLLLIQYWLYQEKLEHLNFVIWYKIILSKFLLSF